MGKLKGLTFAVEATRDCRTVVCGVLGLSKGGAGAKTRECFCLVRVNR